jgi:hypothetical protein
MCRFQRGSRRNGPANHIPPTVLIV